MSDPQHREMKCAKCDQVLPGVERAGSASAHYWVDADRIKRPEDSPLHIGGQYECPHCGATYSLILMPAARAVASAAGALYRFYLESEGGLKPLE